MNAWEDENFVAAVEKTGRKKILLAALWTETCVALPSSGGSSRIEKSAQTIRW